MESSRRDLFNEMSEHRSILKNNQYTHYSLIFQDRPMFSHINGKLSPRAFDDMTEHESILKINQDMFPPVLVSHPKQV